MTLMSAKNKLAFAISVSLLNPHAIMDTVGVIGTSASVYSGSENFIQYFYYYDFMDMVYFISCIREDFRIYRSNWKIYNNFK